MPSFSHQAVIERPIEAVFDVATTAKHWPNWHPATVGVGGQTERPAQLGDQIIERATIAGRTGEGTWTVVERVRPYTLTLQSHTSLGEASIHYTLREEGGRTVFQRDLSYELGPPELEAVMEQQSAQGVRNLKALLERLIPPAETQY